MILLFVGFWELVVIAVVAIMLLDTSSLLKTARFLGHLYQRVQKSISDIRSHITLFRYG
jgi:Sec-independent protein translocase protein TatA